MFKAKKNTIKVRIYNGKAQIIYSKNYSNKIEINLNISDFVQGKYFIELVADDEIYHEYFIKL